MLIPMRNGGTDAAIVFIHGFGGDAGKTWGDFPAFLVGDPRLAGWDVFSYGYPTTLRLDVPFWKGDPDIRVLSLSLRSALRTQPLLRYKSLALVAHSMGGLVAQAALLQPEVAMRVSHCFLFGTPSAGLRKARLGRWLKKSARDMEVGSEFISALRRDWTAHFPDDPPFHLRVVQGDLDSFVGHASSLDPFQEPFHEVVEGDHVSMIKPESGEHRSVQLVLTGLLAGLAARGFVDSARLAVEKREFEQAIAMMLPRADDLDDAAAGQLALALDAVGRGSQALEILARRQESRNPSTDAMGILAGRIKRRWLVERDEADWIRARKLYAAALDRALQTDPIDHDQAAYLTINLSFLDLMASAPDAPIQPSICSQALAAATHARQAGESYWTIATIAEAALYCGNSEEASQLYRRARAQDPGPRATESMYAQAIRVAVRIFGEDGAVKIESAFGLDPIL